MQGAQISGQFAQQRKPPTVAQEADRREIANGKSRRSLARNQSFERTAVKVFVDSALFSELQAGKVRRGGEVRLSSWTSMRWASR